MAEKLFLLSSEEGQPDKDQPYSVNTPVKDFLDFLETAFLLQGTINGTLENTPPKKRIDWTELAKNRFVSNIANIVKNEETFRSLDKQRILISNEEVANKNENCVKANSENLSQENNQTLSPKCEREIREKSKSADRKDSNALGAKGKTTSKPKRESVLQSSEKKIQKRFESTMRQKLMEVLNEGLLDSILPYIAPNTFSMSNFNEVVGRTLMQTAVSTKKENKRNACASGDSHSNHHILSVSSNFNKQNGNGRRKSSTVSKAAGDASSMNADIEKESVVIHVCDESKNTSKDFRCSQKLLVQQMGYFADVQSGQKLEDMDISVHCDISIFDWLMRWVKRDMNDADVWPVLDAANVTPILVSATFLRMQPLVLDCLMYCHGNLSDVIRASTGTMTCLNDSIITRLAAMYTNVELEAVKDKRDRIQSRLFCRLICSLAEPDPEVLRGHYATLRSLFKCVRCGQLVSRAYANRIPCASGIPGSMRLNRYGYFVSAHQRDPSWTLSDHICKLHKSLRSWRRVYWRLWGECHYLECPSCMIPFPVSKFGWCRARHPRDGVRWYQNSGGVVNTISNGEKGAVIGVENNLGAIGIVGRYECCGSVTFKFEALNWPLSCEYRDHMVEPNDEREDAILQLYLNMSQVIQEEPPEIAPIEENKWWSNLTILPVRPKSLVPTFQDNELLRQQKRNAYLKHQISRDIVSEQTSKRKLAIQRSNTVKVSSDSDTDYEALDFNDALSSSDVDFDFDDTEEGESEENNRKRRLFTCKRRARTGYKKTNRNYCNIWSEELSARSNQDNQREYEEKAMRQLINMLNRKNGIDTRNNNTYQAPAGGSYIKLENEWKDSQAQWSSSKSRRYREKSKH